ncbi:hypothetical protein BGZ47_004908, partial [Haplosporangium gracile]
MESDYRLLDNLSPEATEDQRTIRKLFNLVHCSEIELLRLELQNYSGAVAFEILRIYLQEAYEARPLVSRTSLGEAFGAFFGHRRALQTEDEGEIFQLCQIFLEGMEPEPKAILGVILTFYMRLQVHSALEEHSELLATKISTLIFSPRIENESEDREGELEVEQVSDDDVMWIIEVWALLYPHLWPSEASPPPPPSTPTPTVPTTTAESVSTLSLRRDSSVRSVDSISSATTVTTSNTSTVSALMSGVPVVGDEVYERMFATWPGEPPMLLRRTMNGKDEAVHEAIGHYRTMEGLRLQIQELRNTLCEAYSRMMENSEEQDPTREQQSPTGSHAESNDNAERHLSDTASSVDLVPTAISAPQADLEVGDNAGKLEADDYTEMPLRRTKSLGTLGEEDKQPSFQRTLSLARNPQAIVSSKSSSTSSFTTISASRFSFEDGGASSQTRPLSAHDQLYQTLRTTKSQPSMGVVKEKEAERPLPLTPVQQGQMKLSNDVQAIASEDEESGSIVSDASTQRMILLVEEYRDEDGTGEHESSNNDAIAETGSEVSIEDGATTEVSRLPSPQQHQPSQRLDMEEMYLLAERHLEILDGCMEAVGTQKEEAQGKLEGMVARYEELVRQFVLATEYQITLEHENEAIRNLYDEVTEENNVIFERFNDELEGIFEAVNTPASTEQAKAAVEDGDCVEESEDGESTDVELRRMLHKAIQDRTEAEQQARRATLQANYFRDLLERHGIQAEAKDFFEQRV